MRFVFFLFIVFVGIQTVYGQIGVPDVPDPKCAYCGYRLPQDAVSVSDPNYAKNHHASSCPYYPKDAQVVQQHTTPKPYVPSQNDQIKMMVTGMVMQSLLDAIFTSNTQQTQQQQWEAQQAELARLAEIAKQKKIQDSIAEVKHLQMMGLYKPLDGSIHGAAGVTDFKTLDGEMEKMRNDASKQFDQSGTIEGEFGTYSSGTNFFGSMSNDQINILFEPENDPMVVDLRAAKSVLADTGAYGKYVQELKKEDPKAPEKPKLNEEECQRLISKIERDLQNKERYEALIDKTVVELEKWKAENEAAMINAFREGLGFLTDQFVDMQNNKNEPVETLKKTMQEILKKDPSNVDAKKMIDFLDKNYLKRNWRESIIRAYNEAKDSDKMYEVMRDAMQNMLNGSSAIDQDLVSLLQSPGLKPYLNDKAFTDACKFTLESIFDMAAKSKKVQNAMVSVFKAKIPYVAYAQFAINEAYNAYHWYKSRELILELNKVHGKELETAQYLQNRIFSDQLKLDQNCK